MKRKLKMKRSQKWKRSQKRKGIEGSTFTLIKNTNLNCWNGCSYIFEHLQFASFLFVSIVCILFCSIIDYLQSQITCFHWINSINYYPRCMNSYSNNVAKMKSSTGANSPLWTGANSPLVVTCIFPIEFICIRKNK